MHFYLLFGLVAVAQSAVPDTPKREGSKKLSQTTDCNGPVVFSAKSSSKSEKKGKDIVINFETPFVDKSIGYSRESGIFTTFCPGLYQFTYSTTGSDPSSRFSLRKRGSSTGSWVTIIESGKTGNGHVVFLEMEVGEQAAVFIDNGSLAASPSHSFSGYRVAKK